jgi:nucleoside-diphosphate-sugar epimerase
MGTVVVTGVAGSLGQRVVGRLVSMPGIDRIIGYDVVPAVGFPEPVEVRILDLAGDEGDVDAELARTVAGADGLIHLAWRTADDKRDTRLAAAAANHRSMQRVVAAAATGSPASLVHLSSATVYGAWADNPVPLSEEAALRPNPEFGFAVEKADAERLVAEFTEDHPEVAVAVLRPTATVGSPERPLYRALGGTGGPAAGDAVRPVQYLHVDDLAGAVVLALAERLRGVYNVAPDAGIPEDTARALAGGVARVTLPARLARLVASWGWELWRYGVPVAARAYATHPWVVAPDRLKAAGWVPRYSSEEALVATDDRPHWDDLPPGRRQNYTLLAVAGGATAATAAASGAVIALTRRRRRRRRDQLPG